jgi:hypothetical protein
MAKADVIVIFEKKLFFKKKRHPTGNLTLRMTLKENDEVFIVAKNCCPYLSKRGGCAANNPNEAVPRRRLTGVHPPAGVKAPRTELTTSLDRLRP